MVVWDNQRCASGKVPGEALTGWGSG